MSKIAPTVSRRASRRACGLKATKVCVQASSRSCSAGEAPQSL